MKEFPHGFILKYQSPSGYLTIVDLCYSECSILSMPNFSVLRTKFNQDLTLI